MKNPFFAIDDWILSLMLFAGCILMVMLGKFLRNRILYSEEPESKGGVNSLLGALFGLWGLILAFTFGNSGSRFENVRSIIVDEANIVRNAINRADLFPDDIRDAYRTDFKKYLDARIDYYDNASDLSKLNKAREDARQVDAALWTRTIQQSRLPNMTLPVNNMISALNSMSDIATKREGLLNAGVPAPVSYMLFFLALIISFIGGFTTPEIRRKEWIVIGGFAFLACLVIYITIDLARPMRGLIKPDMGEQAMVDLLKMF